MNRRLLARLSNQARRQVLPMVLAGAVGLSAAVGAGASSVQAFAPAQCSAPSKTVLRPVPWAQRRLDPKRAWELTRGEGVTVAVIDTGVDATVRQLDGQVLPGVDLLGGGKRADDDCFGHGTFVAGIIAAQPTRDVGFVGIAPGAKLLPIRQSSNTSDGTSSNMAKGIKVAVDAGAKVINISAASSETSAVLEEAVQYATARDVLIVAAAANEAERGNPRTYPATYPDVVAVGAIAEDGSRGQFSEFGDFLDLAAPGVQVMSVTRGGDGHAVNDGTSYAAPFVAGVAALVRSYHPDLSASEVKHRLEATADHPAGKLPNTQIGWGVVNPYQAVASVLPEEAGAGAQPKPQPQRPALVTAPVIETDNHVRDITVVVGAGGVLILVLLATVVFIIPRGRRRGWRPAARR